MRGDRVRLAQLERRVTKLEETVKQLAAAQGLPIAFDNTDEEMDTQIVDLIKHRSKIEAIKLYREVSGTGLKEAKEYVEDLEERIKRGEL